MTTSRKIALLLTIPTVFGCPRIEASPQHEADKLPAYDVSTIKLNASGTNNSKEDNRIATFSAENIPVAELLRQAFRIPPNLIFGLPGWAISKHFDVQAKILEPDLTLLKTLTPDQRCAMLKALYSARFNLKWHYETRIMDAYELLLTKDGPKFTKAARSDGNGDTRLNNTDFTGTAIHLSSLTEVLTVEMQRPVIDKTGISGRYDLHLKWTREGVTGNGDADGAADTAPLLVAALKEELGLKLQARKDAVQVLVIDHISLPDEN